MQWYKQDSDAGGSDYLTTVLYDYQEDPVWAEGGDTNQSGAPAADAGNGTGWGLNNQWRATADAIVDLDSRTTVVEGKAHEHSNKTELDKVTDGDHDVRTDNPHSTTKTHIGLPNVTNHAQLKRDANDFSGFPAKAIPVNTDILLIEDSAAAGAKKYCTINQAIAAIDRTRINDSAGTTYVDCDEAANTLKMVGQAYVDIDAGTDFYIDVAGDGADIYTTTAGSDLTIRSKEGGGLVLTAGVAHGSTPAHAANAMSIYSAGVMTIQSGGAMTIKTPDAAAAVAINITAGDSSEDDGGDINITAGKTTASLGTKNGGNVTIMAGGTDDVDGGYISIMSGSGGSGYEGGVLIGLSGGGDPTVTPGIVKLNAYIDAARLTTQPTGAVDLAVSTTKYVDDEITTLTGLVIKKDGSVAYTGTGDGFKDEDNMASDSATATASQQSIKAYSDNYLAGQNIDAPEAGDDGLLLFWDNGNSKFDYKAADKTIILTLEGNAYTGTGIVKIQIPYALTVSKVYLGAGTAPTGSALTYDVNYHASDPDSATSIFNTNPSIAATSHTGNSTDLATTSLAQFGWLVIDCDAVGSIESGADITIGIIE